MSVWDDLIHDNRRWVDLHQHNPFQAEAARRMTAVLDAMDALLADGAVERAARAMTPQLWRLRDEGYESETHGQQVESSLLIARAVLTAALGKGE